MGLIHLHSWDHILSINLSIHLKLVLRESDSRFTHLTLRHHPLRLILLVLRTVGTLCFELLSVLGWFLRSLKCHLSLIQSWIIHHLHVLLVNLIRHLLQIHRCSRCGKAKLSHLTLHHHSMILHHFMRIRWHSSKKLGPSRDRWDFVLWLRVVASLGSIVWALTISNQVVNVYSVSALFLPWCIISGTLNEFSSNLLVLGMNGLLVGIFTFALTDLKNVLSVKLWEKIVRRWQTMLNHEELLPVSTLLGFSSVIKVIILEKIFVKDWFAHSFTLIGEWFKFALWWRAFRFYATILLGNEIFLFKKLFFLGFNTMLIYVLWQGFTIVLFIGKIWKLGRVDIVHRIREQIRLVFLFRSLLRFHRCLHLIDRLGDLLQAEWCETI